jgi:hypothetical protein
LDEAIGFNANAVQISDVRSATGLAALGSYSTMGNADNGSGVLLVGQAFEGSGLPPVLAYGTDIPVLQFNVTVSANAAVGSETALTLLQDGTIKGQTKFTAISDNEGALTWTPGMAPSNSGNAAIDGTVLVEAPTTPVDAKTVVAPAQSPIVLLPRLGESVRRVLPVIGVISNTLSPAKQAGGGDPSVSLVAPLVSNVAVTAVEEPAVVTTGALQSTLATVQPGFSNLGVAAAITPVEVIAPSAMKSADSGASLSLVTMGSIKLISTPATATTSIKTSISALDEMYRLLGTPLIVSYAGAADRDAVEELAEVGDLETMLLALDEAN